MHCISWLCVQGLCMDVRRLCPQRFLLVLHQSSMTALYANSVSLMIVLLFALIGIMNTAAYVSVSMFGASMAAELQSFA